MIFVYILPFERFQILFQFPLFYCLSVLKKDVKSKQKKCGQLSSELTVLCYCYQISHQFCSFVPFFNFHFVKHENKDYITDMHSFVEKISCAYILLPPIYCNPTPRLLTLSCFSNPQIIKTPFNSGLKSICKGNYLNLSLPLTKTIMIH